MKAEVRPVVIISGCLHKGMVSLVLLSPYLSWSLSSDTDVGPVCGVELSTCIISVPKSVCPLPCQEWIMLVCCYPVRCLQFLKQCYELNYTL